MSNSDRLQYSSLQKGPGGEGRGSGAGPHAAFQHNWKALTVQRKAKAPFSWRSLELIAPPLTRERQGIFLDAMSMCEWVFKRHNKLQKQSKKKNRGDMASYINTSASSFQIDWMRRNKTELSFSYFKRRLKKALKWPSGTCRQRLGSR